jgi:hypothetical protein
MDLYISRIGIVIEEKSPILEPGLVDDYNQQQCRRLRAEGVNCTSIQFAEWFIAVHGGTICGDYGLILDFGEVSDSCLGNHIELFWDDRDKGVVTQFCRAINTIYHERIGVMDIAIEREETRDMRLTFLSSDVFWMVPTKRGNLFDGVLQDATISSTACGHLFGSASSAEGMFVATSQVVKVGSVLGIGNYVETESRSRYLVSSVEENSSLDEAIWFERKARHIDINIDYFRPLQWSL